MSESSCQEQTPWNAPRWPVSGVDPCVCMLCQSAISRSTRPARSPCGQSGLTDRTPRRKFGDSQPSSLLGNERTHRAPPRGSAGSGRLQPVHRPQPRASRGRDARHHDADSVVVRFRYQDRQRGPRFETLYKLGRNRRVLAIETRSVTPEGTLGGVTQRVGLPGRLPSIRLVGRHDAHARRPDVVLRARHHVAVRRRAARPLPAVTPATHVAGSIPTGPATRKSSPILPSPSAERSGTSGSCSSTGSRRPPTPCGSTTRIGCSRAVSDWFITVPRDAVSVLPALHADREAHPRRARRRPSHDA